MLPYGMGAVKRKAICREEVRLPAIDQITTMGAEAGTLS